MCPEEISSFKQQNMKIDYFSCTIIAPYLSIISNAKKPAIMNRLLHSLTKLDGTPFTFVYRCGRTLFSLSSRKNETWWVEDRELRIESVVDTRLTCPHHNINNEWPPSSTTTSRLTHLPMGDFRNTLVVEEASIPDIHTYLDLGSLSS